ncbi:hypothetical protein ACFL36_05320 [Thermodesulfobacteriota bacterium]
MNMLLISTDSQAQNLWWLSEYPDFIKFLSKAPQKTLKTSYKAGPKGEQEVFLIVSLQSKQKLVLTTKLPKEAMSTIDEKTGKRIPDSVGTDIIIRDNNLDGMLNDFKMEPGQPPKGAILTNDGFMKFTGSKEDKVMLLQWMVGIGYCINHYLHGIDWPFPK